MSPPSAPEVVIVAGDFVMTGGMDRANYAVAEHLARLGRRVELVAHRVAPELAALDGVSVRRAPKPLGSYMLGEPFLARSGRRAARSGRVRGAVTLVNGGNAAAAGVNWVHYVHAAYEPRQPWTPLGAKRRLFHALARERERAALCLAVRVVANSHATKRALIQHLGVPADRIHVVYCGVDARRFTPTDADFALEARRRLGFSERPLVAFVGALGDQRKGFDTLFDAWRTLCARPSWDADLLAIGGGREVERFRARAVELRLDGRMRLLGFRTDVADLVGACDALVAPSRYEPYGVGVAEALARGIPALVSSSAGVAELYPPELADLLLEDPESVADLVVRLERWRAQLDTQRARVAALGARVRAHDWADMAAEITRHLDATREAWR